MYRTAVDRLFLAAPFMAHFQGPHMLAVHAALDALFTAFTTPLKDEPDPKRPYHPDEVSEVEWVLRRDNLPSWTVLWSYASRARLRELKRSDINDPYGPDPVYQSTRIKPGAIVYRKPSKDVIAEFAPLQYIRARQAMFKVDYIEGAASRTAQPMVHLIPFYPKNGAAPPTPLVDLESGRGNVSQRSDNIVVPLNELVLLEKNRGKAGALNFFNEYLRSKVFRWGHSHGLKHGVQTFTGIVDARHALVETDIFWNDALPYFAKVESTGKPGKRFGSLSEHSICITVQYPQFFTNIGEDDVLDNTNSTYYNLWQTLRDGAKCICSSGTNTIWDISNPAFEFCTTSRSEDLGTSHEYIPHCASVYLCVNVAFGIAKKAEDFLEALYRWSAGPLELLWVGFTRWKILKHYVITAVPSVVFAMASFHENCYWYYGYVVMVWMFSIKALVDYCAGRKPLRDFTVSTVIATNLFIVCANLMSVMWYVIVPVHFAFYSKLPFGYTATQGLFWAWVSVFLSLGTGLSQDALIRIARHTAPATKTMNYDRCLWRGSQLYACSFMYTVLATIAGSWSAYKAWMWDYDLSMWSSFRVSDSEYDKLHKSVADVSVFSSDYATFLYEYCALYLRSCMAALTMPTVMTRWYVTGIFLLQIVCIFVSTFITNRDNLLVLLVVALACGLNTLMTVEVAMLMQPWIQGAFGFPYRADYLLVGLGLIILISAGVKGELSMDAIGGAVRLSYPF
jgi:hypothetical protein